MIFIFNATKAKEIEGLDSFVKKILKRWKIHNLDFLGGGVSFFFFSQ